MAGLKQGAAKNILMVLAVLALTVLPLLIQRGSEFSGADGKAESAVSEVRPGYRPWFEPVWTPPGGEVESMLFALQAALGAGFVGYYFGYQRGKNKREKL